MTSKCECPAEGHMSWCNNDPLRKLAKRMAKKADALGDRMKLFEMTEAGRKAMPGLPLLVRRLRRL